MRCLTRHGWFPSWRGVEEQQLPYLKSRLRELHNMGGEFFAFLPGRRGKRAIIKKVVATAAVRKFSQSRQMEKPTQRSD